MQKMTLEYAQKILDGGYAFGNRFLSCHDDLLVSHYSEDSWPYEEYYTGTQLKDGELQVDAEGYVHFIKVYPEVDENTRFSPS